MKKVKLILSIFPVLFLLENIFGYNGTMIMVSGKAIRHWLYLFTFLSLVVQFFICLKVEGYKLISLNQKSYIKELNILDWCTALLCFSFVIWMTVVPLLNGGNIVYAKRDAFDALCILILYFPLSFLIKKRWYIFEKIENIIYVSVIIQSIQNIIFYFGETIRSGFMEWIFETWAGIFEDALVPPIILGHGNTARVIFSTSMFLFIGIMICLKKIVILKKDKIGHYVSLVIFTIAVLCTMTKSIWLGFLGSALFVTAIRMFWKRKQFFTRQFRHVVLLLVAVILVSNYTIFNNRIVDKVGNSFFSSFSDSSDDDESENEKLEKEASKISNDIKIEQVGHLIDKWKESPIIGHGYGAYCEDYLRSKEAVFSYEMIAPALLMKLGIIGIAIWAIYFIVMIFHCYKTNKLEYFTLWFLVLLSYGLAIQTNPFMFSFAGIITILYCSLAVNSGIERKEYEV